MRYFAALIMALFCLVTMVSLIEPIETRIDDSNRLAQEYSNALKQSQAKLTELMHQITEDPIFIQNLDWGLENSFTQYLKGKLIIGQLDGVLVFDQSCKLVGTAVASALISRKCPQIPSSKLPTSTFSWKKSGKLPSLTLTHLVQNKDHQPHYIQGVMVISNDWLAGFPDLRDLLAKLAVRITSHQDLNTKALLLEGNDGSGQYIASLISHNTYINIIAKLTPYYSPVAMRRALLVITLVTCLLTLITVLHFKRIAYLTNAENGAFYEWSKDLVPQMENEPFFENRFKIPKSNLEAAKELITYSFQYKHDTIHLLERELVELKAEKAQHSQEIKISPEKLLRSRELESFASQINAMSEHFLKNMREIDLTLSGLSHELKSIIVKDAQDLISFTSIWQKHLGQTSPRKFFRTLSEQQTTSGDDLLNEQLSKLFALSKEIGAKSLYVSLRTDKLMKKTQDQLTMLSHWYQTSSGKVFNNPEPLTMEHIRNSQRIVKIIAIKSKIIFLNQLPGDRLLDGKVITSHIWITLFYHLYMAYMLSAEDEKVGQLEILSQVKIHNNQELLVIAVTKPHSLSQFSLAAMDHFQLAEEVARNYGLNLKQLPTINGIAPITVSNSAAISSTKKPDANRRSPAEAGRCAATSTQNLVDQ